jgi:hypothetical protein
MPLPPATGGRMGERLKKLLLAHAGPVGLLGGGPVDRERLLGSLRDLGRHYRSMMWLASGMVLLTFLVELGLVLKYVNQPKALAGIAGGMGLTVAGAIETIRRIGREMVHTNLLVVLAGELDVDALKPIITTLVRKL